VQEVCRKYNIAIQTYYAWKTKFGGMTVSNAKKLKVIEAENTRLKRLVADQALDIIARMSCQKSGNPTSQKILLKLDYRKTFFE
jgi:hypothetical protein